MASPQCLRGQTSSWSTCILDLPRRSTIHSWFGSKIFSFCVFYLRPPSNGDQPLFKEVSPDGRDQWEVKMIHWCSSLVKSSDSGSPRGNQDITWFGIILASQKEIPVCVCVCMYVCIFSPLPNAAIISESNGRILTLQLFKNNLTHVQRGHKVFSSCRLQSRGFVTVKLRVSVFGCVFACKCCCCCCFCCCMFLCVKGKGLTWAKMRQSEKGRVMTWRTFQDSPEAKKNHTLCLRPEHKSWRFVLDSLDTEPKSETQGKTFQWLICHLYISAESSTSSPQSFKEKDKHKRLVPVASDIH